MNRPGFPAWRGVLALVFAAAPVHAAQLSALGCLMEPDRVAEVGSPVVGVIDSIAVERGDRVRQGQTLALLKADVERASVGVAQARAESGADVRGAQANVEFTRQKLARAQDLVARKFIAEQALDQARAEAQVAEERLALAREQQRIWRAENELARQQLSQRAIRAPFDGIVAERYVSAGERIEEKPAFRIVKTDPLRVEVVVPSSMFGIVKRGMVAQIAPDLPGAKPIKTKVVLVDRVVDGASNTFRIRANLPNANGALPSGLRCKAELGDQPATVAAASPASVSGRSDQGVAPRRARP